MRKLIVYLIVFSIAVFLQFGHALAASNLEEGVSQLANQISKNMLEKQKQKIAIIDFSDLNGNVTTLGQFMAEELTTQLFMIAPGKFEVVERRQLLKLEEELMLGQTGFIEEKSIKKMGQVLGVDAIVTGSMTDLGNTVKINARLIGVESAKVFAVAATDIPKTGMVADLIVKQAGGKVGVIEVSPITQQPKTADKISNPIFQNDFIRITVKSLKKTRDTAMLVLEYENLSEETEYLLLKVYMVGIGSIFPYLTDENGDKWDFERAENIATKSYGSGTPFAPKFPKMVKIAFKPIAGTNGVVFSAVIPHLNDRSNDRSKRVEFEALFRDIRVTK